LHLVCGGHGDRARPRAPHHHCPTSHVTAASGPAPSSTHHPHPSPKESGRAPPCPTSPHPHTKPHLIRGGVCGWCRLSVGRTENSTPPCRSGQLLNPSTTARSLVARERINRSEGDSTCRNCQRQGRSCPPNNVSIHCAKRRPCATPTPYTAALRVRAVESLARARDREATTKESNQWII
jgi:hypothetical protein